MVTATKSRPKPKQRAAAATRAQRRAARARPQKSNGPDVATIVTWGVFALAGLVLAAGVAAIVADDVPFEDRNIRDLRLRLRSFLSHAPVDALESLRHQLSSLQSDVQSRIAQLR